MAESVIVAATGIAVGMHGEEKTPLGIRMEEAMHQAILMGRSKGETEEQIKARIDAARYKVLSEG